MNKNGHSPSLESLLGALVLKEATQRLSPGAADVRVRNKVPAVEGVAVRERPAIDWAGIALPDAWPDNVRWLRPRNWRQLWGKLRGLRRERVRLPPDLPGREKLPPYLLLEFHNLPNGNYSRRISHGYSRGFDIAMLGTLHEGRARIAQDLHGARCALDLGSGAGHLAGAMAAAGIPEVWGLEPSPYLLQIAARAHPEVNWRQAVGEDSGLPTAKFDAVGICFVLHEVPPHYTDRLLAELHRIMQPGARLVVLEPSPLQYRHGALRMWRSHSWRGLYFRLMAKHVYEPFLEAWHKVDVYALWSRNGFRVVRDETGCPYRYIVAERI